MDWMNEVRGVLGRYRDRVTGGIGAAGLQHVVDDSAVQRDFELVARKVPRPAMAAALQAAFRSPGAPPFSEMLARLFVHANADQKAELLNRLIAWSPPSATDEVVRLVGGETEVTAEAARTVAPDLVSRIAAELERHGSPALDRIGEYCADHPKLAATLGIQPLVRVLQMLGMQLSERRSGGGAGA